MKTLSKTDIIPKGTELFNDSGELLGEADHRLGEGDRYIGIVQDGRDYLLVRDHTYVQTAQRAIDLDIGDLVYVERGRGKITTGQVAIVTQVLWDQKQRDRLRPTQRYDSELQTTVPVVADKPPYPPDVLVRGDTGEEYSLFSERVTKVELLRVERTGIELTDEYGYTDGPVHHAREEQ